MLHLDQRHIQFLGATNQLGQGISGASEDQTLGGSLQGRQLDISAISACYHGHIALAPEKFHGGINIHCTNAEGFHQQILAFTATEHLSAKALHQFANGHAAQQGAAGQQAINR